MRTTDVEQHADERMRALAGDLVRGARVETCPHCGLSTDRQTLSVGEFKFAEKGDAVEIVLDRRDLGTITFEHRASGSHQWFSRGVQTALSMERHHRVAPGYFHAVEDLCLLVLRLRDDLTRSVALLREKLTQQFQEESQRLHASVREMHDDAHRLAYAGRHRQLATWRTDAVPANEAPAALRGVSGLRQLNRHDDPCFVYFLLKDGVVVYVGQTTKPWPLRALEHMKEGAKDFDDVWYTPVDRQNVYLVEMEYIRRFQPRYNTNGNPAGRA